MTNQEIIRELKKIQDTLSIRGSDISEHKANKMLNTINSVINAIKENERIDCGVCDGSGERMKNNRRFACVPCGGTGVFIGTISNN